MKKILTAVAVACLVCFGFLIPLREAGALTIDFNTYVANSISTGSLGETPWGGAYPGLSVWAFSTLGSPAITRNLQGLGVVGNPRLQILPPPDSDRTVNNSIGLVQGLAFRAPDGWAFTSVTLSGLQEEMGLVRGALTFSVGNIGDFLTGEGSDFLEVRSGGEVELGDGAWSWLLVRTPLQIRGDSSFYVAQVEIQAVPEPAVIILLGCGLIGIGVFRRISKKS